MLPGCSGACPVCGSGRGDWSWLWSLGRKATWQGFRKPEFPSLATAPAHVCSCPTEKPRIQKLFSSSCLWQEASVRASYWQNLTGREPAREQDMCRFQTPSLGSKEQSTEPVGKGPRINHQHPAYTPTHSFQPVLTSVHSAGHVQGSGEVGGLGRQRNDCPWPQGKF